MKKYLSLIALVLAVTSAHADFWTNCTNNGGTIIQANSYGNDKGGLCNDPSDKNLSKNCNGKRFCVSNNNMNWWSAFTWCEAMGGHLTDIQTMCPETTLGNKLVCPNFNGVINGFGGWSHTSSSASAVWTLGWHGYEFDPNRQKSTTARAFCEEK